MILINNNNLNKINEYNIEFYELNKLKQTHTIIFTYNQYYLENILEDIFNIKNKYINYLYI